MQKKNNAMLIEINPNKTEMSSEMDLVIRSSSANTLPKLVSVFKEGNFDKERK